MGKITFIRPRDDAASQQASDWADSLSKEFTKHRHIIVLDVDDTTPPNKPNILHAVRHPAHLICYFGHGDEDCWLTNGKRTFDASNISRAAALAVISVACKTACKLGPDAITAGVKSWLGFTISVAAIAPHRNVDPIGDAIVDGLAVLSGHGTMQDARDEVARLLAQVVKDYGVNGKYYRHPEAGLGYYAAMAMRDHIVVHGKVYYRPLPR